MNKTKSYAMNDVGALIALAATPPTLDEIRGFILQASDVPVERVDACAAEAIQMVEALRGLPTVMAALGNEITLATVAQVMGDSWWVDDCAKTVSLSLTVVDDEGGELHHSRSRGKLN